MPSSDLPDDTGHLISALDRLLGVRESGVSLLDILRVLDTVLVCPHDPGVITVSLLQSAEDKETSYLGADIPQLFVMS